jgi:hypothetical protein
MGVEVHQKNNLVESGVMGDVLIRVEERPPLDSL